MNIHDDDFPTFADLTDPTERTWHTDAACTSIGPDLFYPADNADGRSSTASAYRDARTICAGCPVRTDCLEKAMHVERRADAFHRHGMWGGLSPVERANLSRERNTPSNGSAAA